MLISHARKCPQINNSLAPNSASFIMFVLQQKNRCNSVRAMHFLFVQFFARLRRLGQLEHCENARHAFSHWSNLFCFFNINEIASKTSKLTINAALLVQQKHSVACSGDVQLHTAHGGDNNNRRADYIGRPRNRYTGNINVHPQYVPSFIISITSNKLSITMPEKHPTAHCLVWFANGGLHVVAACASYSCHIFSCNVARSFRVQFA